MRLTFRELLVRAVPSCLPLNILVLRPIVFEWYQRFEYRTKEYLIFLWRMLCVVLANAMRYQQAASFAFSWILFVIA